MSLAIVLSMAAQILSNGTCVLYSIKYGRTGLVLKARRSRHSVKLGGAGLVLTVCTYALS